MQENLLGSVVRGADWPKRLVFWASVSASLFLCVWYRLDIILLAFAGSLLAIILHACADWLDRHTPRAITHRLSYAFIVLGIVLVACLIGYWVIPRAITEITQLSQVIPKAISQVKDYLNQSGWGRHLVQVARNTVSAAGQGNQITTVTRIVEGTIEGAVVILVIGLYGALYARGYASGLLDLVPDKYRERVAGVSKEVIYTLRWWMIGQLIPMVILGVSTAIGLWLLQVPMALILGLFTGAMIFIPYVGAWLAFIPTVLVALTKGPSTVTYVIVLYLTIHLAEGYALTPLVQKKTVLLPPVMTILSQLFMWKVAGLLGVALATPIAAASLVLVKTLYLHEEVEPSTANSEP